MLKQLSSAIAALCLLNAPAAAQDQPTEEIRCRCLSGDYVPVTLPDFPSANSYYGLSYTNHTSANLASVDIVFWESNGESWIFRRVRGVNRREKATYLLVENEEARVSLTSVDEDPRSEWFPEAHAPNPNAGTFGSRRSSMLIRACAEDSLFGDASSGRFTGTGFTGLVSGAQPLQYVPLTELPASECLGN